MRIPSDQAGAARPPLELLRGASLFLDFDGTLVDIRPTPGAVRVSRMLRDLLLELKGSLEGRVAILSGRSVAEVEQLLSPVRILIGGSHGLETQIPGGERLAIERPDCLDAVVAELRQVANQHPGVVIEDKPLGVALHYRQAPEAEEACRTAAISAAASNGLELQPGKMVFELRPGGANKGAALRKLMSEPPFRGTSPVFLGDDLTDEPGFEAADELGGVGVLIGAARPTAARYRLETVGEALAWLSDARGALE